MNILPDRREKLNIQRIDTGVTSILSTSVIENSSPYYPSENEREAGSSFPPSLSNIGISNQRIAFCNVAIRRININKMKTSKWSFREYQSGKSPITIKYEVVRKKLLMERCLRNATSGQSEQF